MVADSKGFLLSWAKRFPEISKGLDWEKEKSVYDNTNRVMIFFTFF
jgi:hypothetical protein